MSFVLDQTLENDSFYIADLPLCTVRLINNSLFPWLILVPKVDDAVEIIDLDHEDRQALLDEICKMSEFVKKEFSPDKLNVAALGNVVSQLHIHIIGRYKEDSAWPDPIWGKGAEPYSSVAKEMMMERLSSFAF